MARKSEIEQLRIDLEEMGKRLMSLTEESGEEMADRASGYADRAHKIASESWSKARDFSGRAGARAQEYAEENPWQIMAAGAAVGFLLGYLLRDKRD